MKKKLLSTKIVGKMVKLSNLSVEKKQISYFTKQFNETLKIVTKLNKLNTKGVSETHHVTKLSNVFRKDKIIKERVLNQKEALSNAKNTYQGYFVVKAIFDEQ